MQDINIQSEIDPWDAWHGNGELSEQADSLVDPSTGDSNDSPSVPLLADSDLDIGEESQEESFQVDWPVAEFGDAELSQAGWRDAESSETDFAVEAWETPTSEELSQLLSQLDACPQSRNPKPLSRVVTDSQRSKVVPSQAEPNIAVAVGSAAVESASESPAAGESQKKIQSLDPELREAFLDDATFCMGAIEAAAMQLESDASNREAILQISRQLHTLKGASASVGLSELADRIHGLEETLRENQVNGQITPIDMLLERLDWFRFQLSAIRNQKLRSISTQLSSEYADLATSVKSLNNEFDSALNSGLPVEPLIIETGDDEDSVRVKTSQLNRLMDMLAELVMLRNRRQTEISHLREIYHELSGSVTKLRVIGAANVRSATTEGNHLAANSSSRAPERTVALLEEGSLQLTEVTADIQEMAQRVRDCTRPVSEGNEAVSQFIRQFRQELVELCRAPATGLFQRLQRAVRDAAKGENKSVRLECLGVATTIERSLQQRLYEPLLHIVRNAVCHGIESSEQRQLSGKQPTGVITLEAISGADLLVIEVRDDGGGLNYQAIRQRAVQQGLVASGQSPTEQELAQLIFHPGFSTRQTADRQAGRGIGMDVVASTLGKLGGWIDVESIPGQGTTIRLNVPLRSAIDHLMIFRCGQQFYSLPLLAIRSAGHLNIEAPGISLSRVFSPGELTNAHEQPSLLIDLEPVHGRSSSSERKGVKLHIDEIIGPEEVVVRPLPNLLRHHPYCTGATISSTGKTVLVLDVRRLLANLSHRELNWTCEFGADGSAEAPNVIRSKPGFNRDQLLSTSDYEGASQPVVLVVDDSVSSRKSVVSSLQRYPIRVIEAMDGRQALQLVRSQRFAAIFSDLEMPHVDGLQLLAEIRAREDMKHTPFTMITSRQEPEFISRAESLGVTRYLSKPISDASLDTAIAATPSVFGVASRPSEMNTVSTT